jgi:hypothetical protein
VHRNSTASARFPLESSAQHTRIRAYAWYIDFEEHPMPLLPRRPAGRANRKALAFVHDIMRLRAEGHSLQAIRDALADAGVSVNASTVRREVLRHRALPATAAAPPVETQPPSRVWPPAHLVASESRSGREVAEVFSRGHISHPLLRKESKR